MGKKQKNSEKKEIKKTPQKHKTNAKKSYQALHFVMKISKIKNKE